MTRVLLVLAIAFVTFAAACATEDETAEAEGPPPSVLSPVTSTGPAAPTTAPESSVTTGPQPTAGTPMPTPAPTGPPPTPAPVTTTTAPSSVTVPPVTVPLDDLVLRLDPVADGFGQPVLAVSPPDDARLFVLDQPGRIWIIDGEEVHEFLDIRDVVRYRGEQGLLGLAFHPEYGENGLFYVDFTDGRGATVLAEFRADPGDPYVAIVESRRDVLRVAQPAANHNGGMIAFGPDGYLWLGLGDGGGANDRYRNGQRADRFLGSMIRLAVGPGAPEPYGLPEPQPFVTEGGLAEVWSIGLRNPWRWAFDGDDLYVADVGQNDIEEINVVPAAAAGLNFGWPVLEGDECFRSADCDRAGMQEPILTYSHGSGCSVTGGFVYRGSALPELDGHYFFGDYCSGWVDTIVVGVDGELLEQRRWFQDGTLPGLTSFGIDSSGEVYAMTSGGVVYRITRG